MADATSKAGFPTSVAGGAAARSAAVAELYRRHWNELCRYIVRAFGPGPPDPEDVAQATFARFAALPEPEAVENPRAFLYRMARNVRIDQHRREAVRGRHTRDAAFPQDQADDRDAERVLSSKQRLAVIDTAIRTMEPRRRAVFVMNRIQDISFAEISRRTGIPEATVKRQVAKAIVECEQALRAAEGADPGGDAA